MRFDIPDMSCGHCVATIEKAITSVDPSASFRPDLGSHSAEIDTALEPDALARILADAGYPATPIDGGPAA